MWLKVNSIQQQKVLITRLEEWQQICEENQLYTSLCQVFLSRARLSYDNLDLEDTDEWLEKCKNIVAESNQYLEFLDSIKNQREAIKKRKLQADSLFEADRPLTLGEQESKIKEYIQDAFKMMHNSKKTK